MPYLPLSLFKYVIVIFCLSFSLTVFAQLPVTWFTLSNVQITEEFDEQMGFSIPKPFFGRDLLSLQNQEIEITGFVFPMDVKGSFYILSKFPYSNCFFCGNKGAGPETVMELRLTKKYDWLKMDAIIKVRGKLWINKNDINQLYYILKDAEIIEE